MSEKRTLTEIAHAHADAMDALWARMYPEQASIGLSHQIIDERGAEHYFSEWVAQFDMPLLSSAVYDYENGII